MEIKVLMDDFVHSKMDPVKKEIFMNKATEIVSNYCEDCIPEGYVSEEIYDDTIKCDVCHENEAVYKAISTNTKEGKLADIILDIIGDMYGSQEMCNPSYDIIELAIRLVKKGVIVNDNNS